MALSMALLSVNLGSPTWQNSGTLLWVQRLLENTIPPEPTNISPQQDIPGYTKNRESQQEYDVSSLHELTAPPGYRPLSDLEATNIPVL